MKNKMEPENAHLEKHLQSTSLGSMWCQPTQQKTISFIHHIKKQLISYWEKHIFSDFFQQQKGFFCSNTLPGAHIGHIFVRTPTFAPPSPYQPSWQTMPWMMISYLAVRPLGLVEVASSSEVFQQFYWWKFLSWKKHGMMSFRNWNGTPPRKTKGCTDVDIYFPSGTNILSHLIKKE